MFANYPATTKTLRIHENTFFTAMAIGMALLVFVGFARTFFLRAWFPDIAYTVASESIFYIHGVLFSAWMLLLVTQPSLIKIGHAELHRRVGVFGALLATSMVVIGILGSIVAARRPDGFSGVPVPPLQWLSVPLLDMVFFGLFVGLAIVMRQNSQSHKRLMLLATINIIDAAIIRLPLSIIVNGPFILMYLFADIFIVLLVFWDYYSLQRIHPVTLWAGLVTVVSQPLRFWMSDTEPWITFATWTVGLLN